MRYTINEGKMMDLPDVFNQIRERAARYEKIVCVYLFGSVAQKTAVGRSDVDIALVVESKKELERQTQYQILADIPFDREVDLTIVDRDSSPLLLYEIVNKGVRLYARSEGDAVAFESYVLDRFYDTQHMRNIYNQQLKEKFGVAHVG